MNITKQDLENEKQALDQRLESLAQEGKADHFQSLGSEHQGYLFQQQDAMRKYSAALGERIRNFVEVTPPAQAEAAPAANAAKGQAPGAPPRSGNEPADPNDGLREPAKGETHKVRSTDKTEKTVAKKR